MFTYLSVVSLPVVRLCILGNLQNKMSDAVECKLR